MGELARPPLVLFTDLDGTLLDLNTYSFIPALEALGRIISSGVPLVFCSSKTSSEQQYYQEQVGIRGVMIVENGSAILIPRNYFAYLCPSSRTTETHLVIELGVSAGRIRTELDAIRSETGARFRGFKEIAVEELRLLTGLGVEAALRAQAREYTETIVSEMSGADLKSFRETLEARGLSCIQGSRFHTVGSSQTDKGKAVKMVTALFRNELDDVCTAGIGDSANDYAMFASVDMAFLLQRPDKSWESMQVSHLNRVEGSGPAAWNRLVCRLIGESSGNRRRPFAPGTVQAGR
jgi:mannosyl-3-phosphoglycerate phosphatase family protein